ncbi:MAG: ABC transporter ATP-binding protein [Exilibacterium sp.]
MIKVESLRYTYPGGKAPTLKGLDFEIASGEIFGFLGPSGSGKSTTQKLLIGLLANYEGQVLVKGKNLKEWGAEYYREIGVGFELPNHFSKLTALENLKLFAAFYEGNTRGPNELLSLLGLDEAANQPVSAFSKGMKMRLNFARAILHDPNIIFLDEPTAGLDPVNARNLKDIVLSLKNEGKTIFLTTHNMHDADELCNRVVFIVEGEMKVIDSPRALKLKYGKKQVLVELRSNGQVTTEYFDFATIGENEHFLSILKSGTMEAIHSQEATLEDVFIKTTGRSLR